MAQATTDAPVSDDARGVGAAAREERVSALAGAALPVGTLNEALPHLRRPFAVEAVKWKVQTVFGPKENPAKGCIVVAYIDARLAIERLNAVCGGAWTALPRRVEDAPSLVWCDLEVFGRVRRDLGESYKGMSKDLWSDAIKRAAVHFGVGVSVYALPQITLYANQPHVDRKDVWDKKAKAYKPSLVLNDKGHEKLREGYERWLSKTGEPWFGPVLDHGDVLPETVDPEAEAALEGDDEFEPAAPVELEDERAEELRGMARALYADLAAVVGGRELPPARFDAWLRQSGHSHAALEVLVEHMRQRVEKAQASTAQDGTEGAR